MRPAATLAATACGQASGEAVPVERIKARYPSFASLLVAVAILLGQEEIPVARELVALSQYQTLGDLYVKILEKLISLGVIALVPPGQPRENCGVIGQTYPCSPQTRMAALSAFVSQLAFGYEQIGLSRGTAYMILESFLVAMDYILSGRGVDPRVNMQTLMEQLLNSIPFLNFVVPLRPQAPPVNVIRDFLSLAQLLGSMVAYGQVGEQRAQWQFYAFGLNVEGGRIEIIATIKLSEFDKPVTIFANTFDFFGESRNNIIQEAVNELNAAIKFIKDRGRYAGQDIAVGFVRSQIDDSTADSIMSQLQDGAPVLFVYCVANCDSGNPVYHLRYRGMTEQQAKALACALGFSDFCERYAAVETGPPWDNREEELCPMALIGSDCSDPPPSDPPPMP